MPIWTRRSKSERIQIGKRLTRNPSKYSDDENDELQHSNNTAATVTTIGSVSNNSIFNNSNESRKIQKSITDCTEKQGDGKRSISLRKGRKFLSKNKLFALFRKSKRNKTSHNRTESFPIISVKSSNIISIEEDLEDTIKLRKSSIAASSQPSNAKLELSIFDENHVEKQNRSKKDQSKSMKLWMILESYIIDSFYSILCYVANNNCFVKTIAILLILQLPWLIQIMAIILVAKLFFYVIDWIKFLFDTSDFLDNKEEKTFFEAVYSYFYGYFWLTIIYAGVIYFRKQMFNKQYLRNTISAGRKGIIQQYDFQLCS